MHAVQCWGIVLPALAAFAAAAAAEPPNRTGAEESPPPSAAQSAAHAASVLIGNAGNALAGIATPPAVETPEDALLRLVEVSHLQVQASALDRLVRKEIDVDVPVYDVLLGVPLTGHARLQGGTKLQLVSDPARGVFDIFLTGSAVSQTVSDGGRAHIHSRTLTRFAARKRVILDATGLTVLPATCNATAKSTLSQATSPLPGLRGRVASRIGLRRALAQLAEADRVSAQHSAAQISRRFDAEVATQLADAKKLLERQTARWTAGVGGRLPLKISTTSDRLCVSGTSAEPLAASALGGSPHNAAAVVMIPADAVDLRTVANLIAAIASDSSGRQAAASSMLPSDAGRLFDDRELWDNSGYGLRFAVERGRLVLALHARDN